MQVLSWIVDDPSMSGRSIGEDRRLLIHTGLEPRRRRERAGFMQRPDHRNCETDHKKGNDMERTGHGKYQAPSITVIQQIANELAKHNSPHGATKTNKSSHRSDHIARINVCRQNHD